MSELALEYKKMLLKSSFPIIESNLSWLPEVPLVLRKTGGFCKAIIKWWFNLFGIIIEPL